MDLSLKAAVYSCHMVMLLGCVRKHLIS